MVASFMRASIQFWVIIKSKIGFPINWQSLLHWKSLWKFMRLNKISNKLIFMVTLKTPLKIHDLLICQTSWKFLDYQQDYIIYIIQITKIRLVYYCLLDHLVCFCYIYHDVDAVLHNLLDNSLCGCSMHTAYLMCKYLIIRNIGMAKI